MSWLDDAAVAIAEAVNVDADDLRLSPDDAATVLDLARIASHTSGDRINAPLLCYALGIARGRGASLDVMADRIKEMDT